MAINKAFSSCVGSWRGVNTLYTPWITSDPLVKSESNLMISRKARDQFISLEYDWVYKGEPQEGLILLGLDAKTDCAQTIWTDSWHSSHTLMLSDGKFHTDGHVSVKGFYKVENSPDWGWRTDLIPSVDRFRMVMYNVDPDGVEEIAVEAEFTRE